MQLAVHTDINDENQTIYFPEIKTTAKDADMNSNISCAKKEITLVDTVSFKGLVPNQKYEVTGTLMDKETKKPVEACLLYTSFLASLGINVGNTGGNMMAELLIAGRSLTGSMRSHGGGGYQDVYKRQ